MRSCSHAGSNHLCERHGSPDRKVGEVHIQGCYHIPFVNDDVRSTVNAGGTIVSCGESTGDIITELGENAFLILP